MRRFVSASILNFFEIVSVLWILLSWSDVCFAAFRSRSLPKNIEEFSSFFTIILIRAAALRLANNILLRNNKKVIIYTYKST